MTDRTLLEDVRDALKPFKEADTRYYMCADELNLPSQNGLIVACLSG